MDNEEKTHIRVIRAGMLIDGTGAEPVQDATVVIEGSKIEAVGKDIEIPEPVEVIDASGKTVMPGLIDSHLHLAGAKVGSALERIVRPRELSLIKAIHDARDCLAAGFTTAKDCGGMNAVFLKKAVAEGTLKGLPRIFAAGHVLTQTYGHGDTHFFPVECADARTGQHAGGAGQSLICDGVEECIKATRYALRQGADFIKVMTTGGVVSERDLPSDVQFNLDEIKCIVDTAAQAGRFVSTHCQNSRGARNSILGGIKTIDHANETNDEVIELARENGVAFVSSLAILRGLIDHGAGVGVSPWGIEKARTQWDLMCESYKRIHRAGAILAAGTDFNGSPIFKIGKNAVELELLVECCDFTHMEAIVAATKNGAMACFMGDKTGTIEPGKLADIIIVDGNPLADIRILQMPERIVEVILNGRTEKRLSIR